MRPLTTDSNVPLFPSFAYCYSHFISVLQAHFENAECGGSLIAPDIVDTIPELAANVTKREHTDGILCTFVGQTVELRGGPDEASFFQMYGVDVLDNSSQSHQQCAMCAQQHHSAVCNNLRDVNE